MSTVLQLAGMVDVWTLQNGLKTGPSLPHPDWLFAACFSPDGQRILTAGHDGLARLWDWQAGQLVCTSLRHPDEIYDAAFIPDSPLGYNGVSRRHRAGFG